MQEIAFNQLSIQIDGPLVTPETVTVVDAVNLAGAYFDLVERIARKVDPGFALTGLYLFNKCAAFATIPSNPSLTTPSTAKASLFIAGAAEPERGLTQVVEKVRAALSMLPKDYTIKTTFGGWSEELRPLERTKPICITSRLSLRATPVSVGGENRVSIRLKSDSEKSSFKLDIDQETAQRIAKFLYIEIDVRATVSRDETGAITGGQLDDFRELAEGDALEIWKKWYVESGSPWDDIVDVDKELGRNEK